MENTISNQNRKKSIIFTKENLFVEFQIREDKNNEIVYENGINDIRFLKTKLHTEKRLKELYIKSVTENCKKFFNIDLDFTETIDLFKIVKPFSQKEIKEMTDSFFKYQLTKNIS